MASPPTVTYMPPMYSWSIATTTDGGVSDDLGRAKAALERTLRDTGAPLGVVHRAFHRMDGDYQYDRIMARAVHDWSTGTVVWQDGDL